MFFNMAVTWERSRPQGLKNVHNFFFYCAENELSMQPRSWNDTDSKKTIFELII